MGNCFRVSGYLKSIDAVINVEEKLRARRLSIDNVAGARAHVVISIKYERLRKR